MLTVSHVCAANDKAHQRLSHARFPAVAFPGSSRLHTQRRSPSPAPEPLPAAAGPEVSVGPFQSRRPPFASHRDEPEEKSPTKFILN